jgi:hypothetical protein
VGAAFVTLFFGVFFAFIQGPDPAQTYVSRIWDVVYGIGWPVGSRLFGHQASGFYQFDGIFGGIVWPVFIFAIVLEAARRIVLARLPARVCVCMLLLFIVSLFVLVPFKGTWSSRAPSFAASMAGAY